MKITFLPKLTHRVCSQKDIALQREKVVPLAEGRILEVGIGSGLNLSFYDPGKVDHIWGLDTSIQLGKIAKKKLLKCPLMLIFCEHGKAPDENVHRWQERINPVWTKISGGCNLNRPISNLIEESGFKIFNLHTFYNSPLKILSYNYRRVAVKG